MNKFFAVVAGIIALTYANSAQSFPEKSEICSAKKVVSADLAAAIIRNNSDAITVVTKLGLPYTSLFDKSVCKNRKFESACESDDKPGECQQKWEDMCRSASRNIRADANDFFGYVHDESKKRTPNYTESIGLARLPTDNDRRNAFFASNSSEKIACHVVTDLTGSSGSNNSKFEKIRIRGKSEDLTIDRKDKQAFKGSSQAKVSIDGSTSPNWKYVTKIDGAVGYAFSSRTSEQVIPYIALNQSITDAQSKSRSADPSNNVAAEIIFAKSFSNSNASYQSVISAAPQFLWNTTDQSQLASVRMIWKPYIYLQDGDFNLNSFHRVSFLPGSPWMQFQFDLRNNTGIYTSRGNKPDTALTYDTFDRAGTRLGLVLTTDLDGPSLTFSFAETLLYGLAGSRRTLDLFEASATYNFDEKKYVGLSGTFKSGRDEDTAQPVHSFTVGLTTRY